MTLAEDEWVVDCVEFLSMLPVLNVLAAGAVVVLTAVEDGANKDDSKADFNETVGKSFFLLKMHQNDTFLIVVVQLS